MELKGEGQESEGGSSLSSMSLMFEVHISTATTSFILDLEIVLT
jgi:hypothetical protein